MFRILVAFLLILTLLTATAQARKAEIVVSAAASLTDVMTAAKAAFETENPDIRVIYNFASSGVLYRQLEQGAPVDVFVSANPRWMDRAMERGLLASGTRRDFAANALVLVTPAKNPARVDSVQDLREERVTRIALGTPMTVPAGQYAMHALTKLGMFNELEPKYIYAGHVRQVLDYVRRGEVDAGFVYRTDAIRASGLVRLVQPMVLDAPVKYPMAVLRGSQNPEAAQRFLEFWSGKQGLLLLQAHGFSAP